MRFTVSNSAVSSPHRLYKHETCPLLGARVESVHGICMRLDVVHATIPVLA